MGILGFIVHFTELDAALTERQFNREIMKLGTLGHFRTCLEDPEE